MTVTYSYFNQLLILFCRSLFVLLYFFFCPLCCLFFFNIRILITPLVYSNFFALSTHKVFSFIIIKKGKKKHISRGWGCYDDYHSITDFDSGGSFPQGDNLLSCSHPSSLYSILVLLYFKHILNKMKSDHSIQIQN